MKNKIGTVFMLLGLALLLGAGGLYLYNQKEAEEADAAASHYVQALEQHLQQQSSAPEQNQEGSTASQEQEAPGLNVNDLYIPSQSRPVDPTMTEVIIDGYAFVGYLLIPSQDIELPVMSETDVGRLRLSPCRYSGSTKTDDLVIGGHNYSRHLKKLSNLTPGDQVCFKDMDGNTWVYEVVTTEILQPDQTEYLANGEYPLTIYTCTYGGKSRVTVRCDRVPS